MKGLFAKLFKSGAADVSVLKDKAPSRIVKMMKQYNQ
jgi:hypothetical protein